MDSNQDIGLEESLNGPAKVGAELRVVRERLGWRLADIATRLKIRLGFLEAIEKGDLAALPAPTYAAGFIRSYAEALGLDQEDILRRFRAEGMNQARSPALVFPASVPDRGVPPGAIALLVAVVAIGGYVVWYGRSEHEMRIADSVPAVPVKLAPLALPKPAQKTISPVKTLPAKTLPAKTSPSLPFANTISQGASPKIASGVVVPKAVVASKSEVVTPQAIPSAAPLAAKSKSGIKAASLAPLVASPFVAPPLVASPAASSSPTPSLKPTPAPTSRATTFANGPETVPETPRVSAGQAPIAPQLLTPPPAVAGNGADTAPGTSVGVPEGGSASLVIVAAMRSWVEIRNVAGKILFSRVMEPGESWQLPDQPGLTITTGNAGGIDLIRNGVPGPPLGPSGSVVHNALITPSGTIVPPPQPLRVRHFVRHPPVRRHHWANPFAIPVTGEQ